jgi:two-component system, OmpR family, phosphate regulon sensor histidine kinase PhoR
MATASQGLPVRDSLVARLTQRLIAVRWIVAGTGATLLVFVIAGAIAWLPAVAILMLVAAIAALAPFAVVVANGATAVVPEAASPDTGLSRFADALPGPCFVLDRRGLVRHANARAQALFPIGIGEALTFRLRVPDLVAAFERVAKGGPPEQVEFGERVPNERWFAAWFSRIEGSDEIVLVLDDLSERRNADRVRVDFVANASHELRTPLASLAGFIETLQGPARDDPAARERFLKIMQEQAERMSRLVNDLLSLSRIEMKQHVRPSDPIDLNAVVREVAAALEPFALELGVKIKTEAQRGETIVAGDRDELIQVFENLTENACKYGQRGGRVVVRVGSGDGGAIVTVRDFGEGIPEEHIPRLTERFYRVDVEASRRHRGTGLGLAIVKHILARHHARLQVESRLGEGSVFSVHFPQASGLARPASEPKRQ